MCCDPNLVVDISCCDAGRCRARSHSSRLRIRVTRRGLPKRLAVDPAASGKLRNLLDCIVEPGCSQNQDWL